jgi:hypothetical protein
MSCFVGVHTGAISGHTDVVDASWREARPEVNAQLQIKTELAVFSPSTNVWRLLDGPNRTGLTRRIASLAKRPRHTARKQRGWLGWARQVLAWVPVFGWLVAD